MYKPLNMFLKQTDELKELIAKYPDYPIVVIVDSEVVADYDYGWWYAPEIRFGIGEILDCEQDVDDEKTYIDRDELEEDMYNKYEDDEEYEEEDEDNTFYDLNFIEVMKLLDEKQARRITEEFDIMAKDLNENSMSFEYYHNHDNEWFLKVSETDKDMAEVLKEFSKGNFSCLTD